ncbi:hypothetical protein O1611_g5590 [Lasiodiplodia mahajangana]|uniref:Uncharacterized protein n=1 Tax=Lasiodiplodia mahajangana TaxID=1108764 RepID=A0ACC2JKI5_9PEZI|nr:hypothetical protein O1611_g5590 [Lasiodiplodia mahajangana]
MDTTGRVDPLSGVPAEHSEMFRTKLSKYRRYGPGDLERFDNLASSHASLGSATIGKVNIDCRFLFTKSKWGLMDWEPAGIIYMDLTFHESKGYRLHSATVTIRLENVEKDSSKIVSQAAHVKKPIRPLQITNWYGPKYITGAKKSVQRRDAFRLNPNVQFAGLGASVGELHRESISTSSSRWRFYGQLLSSERGWKYDTLQWELSENDFERQTSHNNTVHTAFTFHHDGRPFFINVDIEGKLKRLPGRLRNAFPKFLIHETARFPGKKPPIRDGASKYSFHPYGSARSPGGDVPGCHAGYTASKLDQRYNSRPSRSAVGGSSRLPLGPRSQPPTPDELANEETAVMKQQVAAPLENLARTIHSNLDPESHYMGCQSQQLNANRLATQAKATIKRLGEEYETNRGTREQVKMPDGPPNVVRASYIPGFLAFISLVTVLRGLFNWIPTALVDMTSARGKGTGRGTSQEYIQAPSRDSLGASRDRRNETTGRGT